MSIRIVLGVSRLVPSRRKSLSTSDIAERGMVVTLYYTPMIPQCSTNELQDSFKMRALAPSTGLDLDFCTRQIFQACL
jgi:hypothetical protein